ncbi:MAG: hypothetical protein WAW39_10480 [Prosthecobacter sp.]|uniref:hypothetical protein n=1 Tax=Prosthecobacter sp. TaxID=1965333 RepID=UPI003BB17020
MNSPAKLIACAAAFSTFHALAAARQPPVVKTRGSIAAHETHGSIAAAAVKR